MRGKFEQLRDRVHLLFFSAPVQRMREDQENFPMDRGIPMFAGGAIVEHVKTRKRYKIACTGLTIEKTGELAYMYTRIGIQTLEEQDYHLWVRPRSEMEDGRFVFVGMAT